ncbi:MAG TPA: sigma-54 dependent transcriptional regulator [Thermoanaerobaculia bacterium]|nr:sigma-54 dependent transcriptional regulator [Thermoanaerobaculia bacterium]
MARVLVVDDDAGIRTSVASALASAGHRVAEASDGLAALDAVRAHRPDVVVTDIYMPGGDGLALLQTLTSARRPPAVILMTARGTVETAALAGRFGAFDYIAKPFDLRDVVKLVAATERTAPDAEPVEAAPPSMMVGSHPSMVAVYKAITRITDLSIPVLVRGESGTGKELVARAIHELGARAAGPFIPLHCGAIPDTLLENELFGSTRGAYTDSRHERRGALARADGGTLFLDEIGDISPAFQVKLLRFLQDGIVTPLGGERAQKVDVRVVAATHRDLKALIARGAFREDLYFRLAGYEIEIPPLRERVSDIALLVEDLRERLARDRSRPIAGPSRALLEVLESHPWPGNVRELEQVVRRIVIDSGALLDAAIARRVIETLTPAGAAPQGPAAKAPPVSLDEAEKRHIVEILRATGGNQTQAAFILGIERKTLARKVKRYQIDLEEF